MAENSAIEWTDHTFNPWEGCQKVGPGCDHCYAEARNARYVAKDHPAYGTGVAPNWGPGAPRRRTSSANWAKPLAWQRAAAAFIAEHGRRQRVFCASLADVFDNAVDPAWRRELLDLIVRTPDLDWLLLTKRIGNVRVMLTEVGYTALPGHVILGATVVNRDEMLRDGPKLKAAPAVRRFWSAEPLLSDLGDVPADLWPDWVIVGGESGAGARPMHPDWARSLRDQCEAAGVPFLFKQWGEWLPGQNAPHSYMTEPHNPAKRREVALWQDGGWGPRVTPAPARNYVTWEPHGTEHRGERRGEYWPIEVWASRVGKKAAGRLLDGVRHDGVPA